MQTKNIMKFLTVAAIVGMMFTSCKKKDTADSDTSAASDNALAEGTYNDVHNISDEAAGGSLASYSSTYTNTSGERADMLSACATITNDTTVTPHMLTINFGTSDCLCADGRYRRGQINCAYSGHYWDSLATHTITFTSYFVNDNQIMGTKTVTNNGRN